MGTLPALAATRRFLIAEVVVSAVVVGKESGDDGEK
jgi:hypothetical protein